ncbi:MAG: hypothetical protein PCFJNLEI_03708 [Verrucomicrobiae bacterium]|nr:hypothetical protein [Verrucomicrobiae bacterium]
MNWYYVAAGQQTGPVTDSEFQQLVATGVIRPETLVWRDGLPEWKPYSQLATATPPVEPLVTTETVRNRDYTIDIGDSINAAWTTYRANFGSILGATLAAFGLITACSLIPFIGFIPQLIVQGPLLGGLFAVLARHIRGEAPPVSEVFSGFKNNFLNLMLTQIVISLFTGLCMLPGVIVAVVGVLVTGAVKHGSAPNWTAMGIWLIPSIALFAVGILVACYLTISWIYALPLAADKRLPFWPAMQLSRQVVGKHWWSTFALMFVAGILGSIGIIGCFIGIIFTLPLSFLILIHQYNKILGDLPVKTD